jgi:hypothetical protein
METIEYRGKQIEIHQDECAESPREWENIGKMVCWHRGYKLGDEQPSCTPDDYMDRLACEGSSEYAEAKDRLEEIDRCLTWRSNGSGGFISNHPFLYRAAQMFVERLKDKALEQYVILQLHLYDHSGIRMSTSHFSCPWDSGQVGFIYCHLNTAQCAFGVGSIGDWSTTLIGPPPWQGKTLREVTVRALKSEVEIYDYYLSGDVYGYVAGDASFWGYFGHNHEQSGLMEAARDAIDYKIQKEIEATQEACNRADVVIEVRGGVAEVTKNATGVKIEIVDHDNEEG